MIDTMKTLVQKKHSKYNELLDKNVIDIPEFDFFYFFFRIFFEISKIKKNSYASASVA